MAEAKKLKIFSLHEKVHIYGQFFRRRKAQCFEVSQQFLNDYLEVNMKWYDLNVFILYCLVI